MRAPLMVILLSYSKCLKSNILNTIKIEFYLTKLM